MHLKSTITCNIYYKRKNKVYQYQIKTKNILQYLQGTQFMEHNWLLDSNNWYMYNIAFPQYVIKLIHVFSMIFWHIDNFSLIALIFLILIWPDFFLSHIYGSTHEKVVRKQEYLIFMLLRVHVTSQFPYIDRTIIRTGRSMNMYFDTTPNKKKPSYLLSFMQPQS